ncbi:MAG: hypothetical protein JWR85_1460 [Marmoricola sp.]|nr:hypothetical protein [Marmoricola sp.]
MRTSIRRALCATAIAGGFTVLGIAFAASSATAADTPSTTSGANGLGSGNQTGSGVHAPVGASGNQVTVIGDGNTSGGSTQDRGGDPAGNAGQSTTGEQGNGSGNQTDAGATAPVSPSGNQVTVIGDGNDNAGSDGGNGRGAVSGDAGPGSTDGQQGNGSGNQTDADTSAPVDASGNQVTVIGDGNENSSASEEFAGSGGGGSGTTSGEEGNASGNQTGLGATAPVDATGNQITVIGDGNTAESSTSPSGTTDSSDGNTTSGEEGNGSGNQTSPTFFAPVNSSDNQVTILGDGNTTRRVTPGIGETGGTEPGDEQDGGTGGATGGEVSAPAGFADGYNASAATFSDAQAGPAAVVAGSLPQTGAAAGLLLWGLLGLAMLVLGLGLVTGRREGRTGRMRGQKVAQAL